MSMLRNALSRRIGRAVEGGGLENRCTPKGYRGFESLILRQLFMQIAQTVRLNIRHITHDDAGFLLKLMNEPAYYENIGDRGVRTVEDAKNYINEKFLKNYEKHGFGLYLVETKDTREPLGINGLIKRDSLPHIDIGFAFHSTHRRQGYGAESSIAMIEHAKILGLKKLVAITKSENQASMQLLQKVGFQFAGKVILPEIGTEDNLFFMDL